MPPGHSIGAVKITFSKCVAAENRPGQKKRQTDARPPETKMVEKWKKLKKYTKFVNKSFESIRISILKKLVHTAT